jgi:hypothetical protein
LQNHGGGLAAWNIQQYDFENANGNLIGTEVQSGKKFKPIFYHFHYLRFYKNNQVELGRRILTKNVLDTFYKPYIKYLEEIKSEIRIIDNSFDPNGASEKPLNWKTPLLYIYRKLFGVYNIFNKSEFVK